jgi:hypothetical protein
MLIVLFAFYSKVAYFYMGLRLKRRKIEGSAKVVI